MHTVTISDLALTCLLGRTGDEPIRQQPVFLDIEYRYDGDLEADGTIDYDAVALAVQEHLYRKHYIYIEDAVVGITDTLWQRFSQLTETVVTLKKPCAIKRAAQASATLRRKV